MIDQYGSAVANIPDHASSLDALELKFAWGGFEKVVRFDRAG